MIKSKLVLQDITNKANGETINAASEKIKQKPQQQPHQQNVVKPLKAIQKNKSKQQQLIHDENNYKPIEKGNVGKKAGASLTINRKMIDTINLSEEENNKNNKQNDKKLALSELTSLSKNELAKNFNAIIDQKNIQSNINCAKGQFYYTQAKQAEFNQKNLGLAEKLYREALKHQDRPESAIKDLATVLHQLGKTQQACKLLEEYRNQYKGDIDKYDNLYKNLQKQINPTGKCYNKNILIIGLKESDINSEEQVRKMFTNSSRILTIQFYDNLAFVESEELKKNLDYCIVSFSTFSAAKKTLQTLCQKYKKPSLQYYWINIYGRIVGEAIINLKQDNTKEDQFKNTLNPYLQNSCWAEVMLQHLDQEEAEAYQLEYNPNNLPDKQSNEIQIYTPFSQKPAKESNKNNHYQLNRLNEIIFNYENQQRLLLLTNPDSFKQYFKDFDATNILDF